MVDELKSLRANLFKVLGNLSSAPSSDDGDEEGDGEDGRGRGGSGSYDASAARALIGALFARAGKGKDEVVQIIAREIGVAVAAMLKEPLSQIAQNQKLQISFELVPKEGIKVDAKLSRSSPKVASKRAPARPKRRKRSTKAPAAD